MKVFPAKIRSAFTLIELLVVVTIIGILMMLASTVLRTAGTGRTLDAGLDLIANMIQEARATAQGNDTYTRLVIADDPQDTSENSPHLRYVVVQRLRRASKENGTYTADEVDEKGDWVSTSAGNLLPPGVYFSPTYSSPLSWAEGDKRRRIGTDTTRITAKKKSRVYYFLFDEKGRYVSPGAKPDSPSSPRRIVLINAKRGSGKYAKDGLVPFKSDKHHRPIGVKGLVLWPAGNISRMRTRSQIFRR